MVNFCLFYFIFFFWENNSFISFCKSGTYVLQDIIFTSEEHVIVQKMGRRVGTHINGASRKEFLVEMADVSGVFFSPQDLKLRKHL